MSDNLNKKVQQIAQLLGHDNVPDNVKELVSLLSASLENNGDASSKDEGDASSEAASFTASTQPDSIKHSSDEQAPALQSSSEDPQSINRDVLATARNALSKLNSSNDPRINLLNAIKPFMNNRRQKKIGNCIQLLQIASLSRLLNEQEKQTR